MEPFPSKKFTITSDKGILRYVMMLNYANMVGEPFRSGSGSTSYATLSRVLKRPERPIRWATSIGSSVKESRRYVLRE
jgi:hypothetical protein